MNWFTKLFISKKDPLHNCIIVKQSGCSHVDGMLCNFNNCRERLEAELFELEQQLDIPYKDRFYNKYK